MCGKNTLKLLDGKICPGSPPRVRKKLANVIKSAGTSRITLTCAGKTNPFFRGTSLIQNHSRVCGKKLTDGISGLTGSGSPPHVQEKHFEDAVKICIRRITPACAGKTVFLVQMMKHHQDHPRVCGKSLTC